VVLISDLDGVVDYEPMVAAARLLTRRGHALRVLVPEAHTDSGGDALTSTLEGIYQRAELRHLREARRFFSRFGVSVTSVKPGLGALTGGAQRPPLGGSKVA
jgi:uncharacterized protein (DUF58 family)